MPSMSIGNDIRKRRKSVGKDLFEIERA